MSKQTDFSFIRYANCWEDTNVLLNALKIKENEVGLSIASAGDNTLALLINNPEKIYAFDINKTQLYELELKIAAMRSYNRAKTMKLLGVIDCKNRMELYRKIQHQLSDDARAYFAINQDIIENGIIHTGKFERFFKTFRRTVVPIVCGTKNIQEFAQLDNIDKQVKFYNEKICTRRYKALIKLYFGAKIMGKFGRDKNFYKYVEDKKEQGADVEKRVKYGISHTVNKTNPYLNYIAFGYYNEESLPLYLRREYYYKIKPNLNKIELVFGNLLDIKDQNFDFMNLSDIFEYMSEEEFQNNIRHIHQITDKGARIAYWNQQNKRYIDDSHFIFQEETSKKLFEKNQSWFYRDFCLYTKKK